MEAAGARRACCLTCESCSKAQCLHRSVPAVDKFFSACVAAVVSALCTQYYESSKLLLQLQAPQRNEMATVSDKISHGNCVHRCCQASPNAEKQNLLPPPGEKLPLNQCSMLDVLLTNATLGWWAGLAA